MDAYNLLARYCKQSKRIVVAQVVLCGRRYVLDVGERFKLVRIDAGRVKPVVVQPDIVIALPHHMLHTIQL